MTRTYVKLGLATMVFAAVMTSPLRADEVTLAGYTNGCFNCATPPNTSASQTASLFGLTYNNSQFSGTTAAGFLAFGGNPIASPAQNVDNLGSFSLANSTATYFGNTFSLRVTFTVPTGINGGGSSIFSALLNGSVTSTGNGGVQVDFNNTPQLYTFSFQNQNGSTTTGSFLFAVNDVSINPGQTASVTGQITAASQTPTTVPEPGVLGMFATGLAGMGMTARRRRIKR